VYEDALAPVARKSDEAHMIRGKINPYMGEAHKVETAVQPWWRLPLIFSR
jgi:hypothetical protein